MWITPGVSTEKWWGKNIYRSISPASPRSGHCPQELGGHEVVSTQSTAHISSWFDFLNYIFSRHHWYTFVTGNFYLLNLTCIQFCYYFISPNTTISNLCLECQLHKIIALVLGSGISLFGPWHQCSPPSPYFMMACSQCLTLFTTCTVLKPLSIGSVMPISWFSSYLWPPRFFSFMPSFFTF